MITIQRHVIVERICRLRITGPEESAPDHQPAHQHNKRALAENTGYDKDAFYAQLQRKYDRCSGRGIQTIEMFRSLKLTDEKGIHLKNRSRTSNTTFLIATPGDTESNFNVV